MTSTLGHPDSPMFRSDYNQHDAEEYCGDHDVAVDRAAIVRSGMREAARTRADAIKSAEAEARAAYRAKWMVVAEAGRETQKVAAE